jgi:isoquinoline 1-oxidoreductase subunit alpha
MAYTIMVNGTEQTVDVDGDTPLLWVLRDNLGMMGTKFGCGIAACGACTIHVDGVVTRSCVFPFESAEGMKIITIEHLSKDGLHPLQTAWIAEDVPQCGYCQTGQIMAAAALLKETSEPTDEEINAAMTNICRCGTYNRIRAAIKRAAAIKA